MPFHSEFIWNVDEGNLMRRIGCKNLVTPGTLYGDAYILQAMICVKQNCFW